MKETIRLPCIFGCLDMKDELSHYLCCDILWTIVCAASHTHVDVLSQTPEVKCCLCFAQQATLSRWNVAFTLYHSLRRDYVHLISQGAESNDFGPVQTKALELAVILSEENFLR